MWWRIKAAWEALTQDDINGTFLRPFGEADRQFIRGNLYNGVVIQEPTDARS